MLESLDTLARFVAAPVAAGIFANQLDELFIDASWFARGLHRRSKRRVTLEELRAAPQKRIAIMVPAWREADVIARMLEHNLRTLDYDRDKFAFFCGTYRNDAETQAEVDAVAARDPRVHKVVVPHDGPTSKADCLNWVWQAIQLEERRRGDRFDVLLMHDAEDVIHPLALRLYSLLIPRWEFVQSAVFSLPRAMGDLVGASYVDEFAEHHLKEMGVRHAMGGLVPSAGVGSAFDRDAFEQIAVAHRQQPFDPGSLTEDYEIGLKFRLAGRRTLFAAHSVEGVKPGAVGLADDGAPEEFIATREYFPARFGAAVRQRSRWVLGIALQSWQKWGWNGSAAVRYCLWRDRKGLLSFPLLLLAYLVFAWCLGRTVAGAFTGEPWDVSRVIPPGSVTWALVLLNTIGLVWRAAMRVHFVRQLHGWGQGLVSLPRLVVNNLIGLCATFDAMGTFLRHRLTGAPLRWVKTEHAFPVPEALGGRRPLLGELLVERRELAPADLSAALSLQRAVQRPLGEVVAAAGYASATRVRRSLGTQLGMPTQAIDPATIPLALLERLPEETAERIDVLPLGRDTKRGPVRLAVVRPLEKLHREEVEDRLGAQIAPVLALAPRLAPARAVAYRRLQHLAPERPRLGEALVARGALSPEALRAALEEQAATGEMLAELLVRRGAVPAEVVSATLAGEEAPFRRVAIGEGDPDALALAGPGFCGVHGVLPLIASGGSARTVAAAFPVHPETGRLLRARLGGAVEVFLAPALDVRLALAMAARRASGRRPAAGSDAAEAAAALAYGLCTDPAALVASARAAGASPLDFLERGSAPARALASARSFALAIPLAARARGDAVALPPALRADAEVCVAEPGRLVLAAPRPSPELSRRAAQLLPGWRIAWQVSTPAGVMEVDDVAAA